MLPKIAIIADPHFHDTSFRSPGAREDFAAVRTLADTVASTRVFNESGPALRAALDDVATRHIRLVIIVGDLLDDGQAFNRAAALALLQDYTTRYGMRFFSTPGNHDLFALAGRHMGKRFLTADGAHILVTSDRDVSRGCSAGRIVTEAAYCSGYAVALPDMAELGYFRRDVDLLWESPFGGSDALEDRTYEVHSDDGLTKARMIDASYLVEPVEGLWILSLDANVYQPRSGGEEGFVDRSEAGWNAVLTDKPFLLSWASDVARRAAALDKRLLVFSHYPAIGPLNTTLDDEVRLFGRTTFARRMPDPAVAEAFAEAGIRVHFSGHWHVNETALLRRGGDFLVNVAVPSLTAFPAAYKTATFEEKSISVETIPLHDVPGFDAAFPAYGVEARRRGADYGGILRTRSYPEFLSHHLAQLVRQRYMPREWPEDFAEAAMRLTVGDLFRLAGADAGTGTNSRALPESVLSLPFIEMVADWYRLRKGRQLALDGISDERLADYRTLTARYAAGSWEPTSIQFRLAGFLRMLGQYLASPPSREFTVDLATGEIGDGASAYFGRTDLRQTGRG
ncbi:metallophosphoesterase family protein [Microvirga subterranea]|uniref:Calcineurin-like phosphoesterase family protein n=1 Tax=Microvirga subterranea TaxID=186651 RepID=A0A370H308_9HYPH|nr:metallophosphoesterase [Microvirga subterranea]RDI50262.1 calcineurin-like phosphoesterase family protein [Microvirga subterranea]